MPERAQSMGRSKVNGWLSALEVEGREGDAISGKVRG